MLIDDLKLRSPCCELCSSAEELEVFIISPPERTGGEGAVLICHECSTHLRDKTLSSPMRWKCLEDVIWSESTAVKVLCFQILKALARESWANEICEQIYLSDEDRKWAEKGRFSVPAQDEGAKTLTRDSNGAILNEGDSVTLIKDLDVKGAGFTAKRGTLVKGIHLTDNPEHIEGKVSGVQIVLVAKFLKKA